MKKNGIHYYLILVVLLFLGLSFLNLPIFFQAAINELYFLGAALLFVLFSKKSLRDFFRLKAAPLSAFLWMILMVILMIPLGSFLNFMVIWLLDRLDFAIMNLPNMMQSAPSPLYALLAFSLLPGICEEALFRGVLLPAYDEQMGRRKAVFFSAFFFGLVHFNPYNLFSPLLLGVVFALVTLRYDSVLPAMFGHALFNGLVLPIDYLRQGDETFTATNLDLSSTNPFPLMAIAMICGVILILILRRIQALPLPQEEKNPPSAAFYFSLILLTLLFVGLFYFQQRLLQGL